MSTKLDLANRATARVTAHELGAQVANETIMRALLNALEKLAGSSGEELVSDIRDTVETGINNASLDSDEHTGLLRRSANDVVESVFGSRIQR